jgi:exonuclease SbcC
MMNDLPIRRLVISDFRRIEGTRELPFDAPVVLIHGPNGTGKTSVLSALELALTGEIRSMERQSDRYRTHLPFLGQPHATVRADVADDLQASTPGTSLTVSGAGLEGVPALSPDAAQFYAERCYLDQSSLSRLLDLYQAREAGGPSALEKFVNELLGLEKLDALRGGLSDANDFRLLKKLAAGVDEADREAKAAAVKLKEQIGRRAEVKSEVAHARQATREAISNLDLELPPVDVDADFVKYVQLALEKDNFRDETVAAEKLLHDLIALSGRIASLVQRPSGLRIEEARIESAAAHAAKTAWETTDVMKVHAWEAKAHAAGVDLRNDLSAAVESAEKSTLEDLRVASQLHARATSIRKQLDADRAGLHLLQRGLADAHEHSSALVEGLVALRSVVETTDMCPVCNRDFSETGEQPLHVHVDAKLAELTNHGHQLLAQRNERDQLLARISQLETEHAQTMKRVQSADRQQALEQRRSTLAELAFDAREIQASKSNGVDLSRRARDLQQKLEDLEAAASEELHVRSELARFGTRLGVVVEPTFDSFQEQSAGLLERAREQVSRLTQKTEEYRRAKVESARLAAALDLESSSAAGLAETAEDRRRWDDRVSEAKRRQGIAKDVHESATRARANVVQRVFNESLNDVWKTVFTRLAPNEGFIPSFGLPSATKKTFDINMETTHRGGEAGGPPQMMLSAGNLNTAALSLFLALHLAVQPVVPCLVFDDPVQAMDEVHVAQLAGLIRLLAKQHGRQVIIAVHERELFDYLTLELSPAYKGDELITIELGERAMEDDQGITRHQWVPDIAIAN